MWEFAARLLSAGALIAVSGWTNAPPFDVAWRIGLLTAAYAFLAYLIEQRKLTNPGFAGLVAGLDSLAIAAALAYSGLLPTMGLLVLAPIVYAVAKRGSNPLATGPIGAGALIGAASLVSTPSPLTLAHATVVLVIALLVNQPRIVVRPRTIHEMIAELAATESEAPETGTQALIELREQHRRLTVAYKQLERKSRVDRISAQILLSRKEPGPEYGLIVEKLRSLLEVDGMILYTSRQSNECMVVSASVGKVPDDTSGLSFPVKPSDTVFRMKDCAEEAIRAISRPNTQEGARTNVVLKHRGLVVGLLTIFVSDENRLEDARRQAEEISDALAQIIMDERMRRKQIRKQKEAELMYEIACRLDGATTEPDIANRATKALSEIIECDHIAVWSFEGNHPTLMSRAGRDVSLFDSFENWLESGAEPIFAYSTAESKWIDHLEAARKRVGSYLLLPILDGDVAIGAVSVAAMAHGALTADDAETVRDVAAEMAHVWTSVRSRRESLDETKRERARARPGRSLDETKREQARALPGGSLDETKREQARALTGGSLDETKREQARARPRGLLTISEFQYEVMNVSADKSCLVYFEPLHFAELREELGAPPIELAARQLGLLIRRHAPTNAQVCRRAEGSFMVLLAGMDLPAARSWANEITALAAMRSVESPNSRLPIPLAVQARAADLAERMETRNEIEDSSTVTS